MADNEITALLPPSYGPLPCRTARKRPSRRRAAPGPDRDAGTSKDARATRGMGYAGCSPPSTNASAHGEKTACGSCWTPVTSREGVRLAGHAKETLGGLYQIECPNLAAEYPQRLAQDLQDQSWPSEVNQLGRAVGRLGHTDQQLAPLQGDQRTDRSHEQSEQTERVRVLELRELPNPSHALCGETELGPVGDRHSPCVFRYGLVGPRWGWLNSPLKSAESAHC